MVKKEDNIPLKYIPKYLSKKDRKKQKKNIEKSITSYKKKVYLERPKLDSYSHKSSKHLEKVKQIYGVDPLIVNDSLAKKTGCSIEGLEKIKNKASHILPKTKEQEYYRYLFEKEYPGRSSIIPYFWMPKWCDESLLDPSAREIV